MEAAMLTIFSGLYEKLVKDVAAQVVATMTETTIDDSAMNAIAVSVFEEMIEPALEQYDPSDLVQQAIDELDIDSELESKVQLAVDEAIENIDLEDKVKAAVQELRFEVSLR